MRKTSISVSAAVCLGMAALVSQPQLARADDLSFPAQTLSESLRALGHQARINMLFDPALTGKVRAPAVTAAEGVEDALRQLLAGTGLTFRFIDERTVTVIPKDPRGAERTEADRSDLKSRPASDVRLARADVSRPQGPAVPVQQDQQAQQLEEIIVTGSHIRGSSPDSSPLISYDRADIQRSGATTVEQFLRTIPQNFSSIGSETALNSGGNTAAQQNITRGASVDLRGLGAGSTLVLVNGHRLAPSGFDGSFVDVSLIPLSAVERIDVLSDGASAIYGADAVGGVVNFILRDDFSGAETRLQASSTTRGGAGQRSASQLLGYSWNSGNVTLAYEFHEHDGLDASRRSFIPDLGGPSKIVPHQRRNSVLLTGEMDVTPSVTLYGDVFFSKREFAQTQTFVVLTSHDSGHAEQAFAVLGGRFRLGNDWQLDVSGDLARQDDEQNSVLEGIVLDPVPTRTDLWSIQARADGPVMSLASGTVRGSVGSSWRREQIEDVLLGVSTGSSAAGQERSRDVLSAFGELLIPLVARDAHRFASRLDLSLAVRYDSYRNRNAGVRDASAASPKIGLLWSPLRDLNVRATFSKSFRAAPLSHTNESNNAALIASLDNPGSPAGQTVTALLSGNNGQLTPETAKSFTFGLDYRPEQAPWTLSGTYFRVDYSDRIAGPPVVGSNFFLFQQLSTLAPFVNLAPSAAEVQAIYDAYDVIDTTSGATPEVIFDGRLHNISRMVVRGVDASLQYTADLPFGQVRSFASAAYLFEIENRAASTTPAVDLRNTIFKPSATRVRAGLDWSRGPITSSITAHHVGSYENNLTTPASRVSSWTTFDWQLSYTADQGKASTSWLRGFSASVSVQNITDRDPPHVSSTGDALINYGYDAMNASPLGRVIAAHVGYRW